MQIQNTYSFIQILLVFSVLVGLLATTGRRAVLTKLIQLLCFFYHACTLFIIPYNTLFFSMERTVSTPADYNRF